MKTAPRILRNTLENALPLDDIKQKRGERRRERAEKQDGYHETSSGEDRKKQSFRLPSLWRKDANEQTASEDPAASDMGPTGGFIPDFVTEETGQNIPPEGDYESKRHEFLTSLIYLKARGVDLDILPGVFFTTDNLSVEEKAYADFLSEAIGWRSPAKTFAVNGYGQKFNLEVVENADLNPQEFLEDFSGNTLLTDASLLNPRKKVSRHAHVAPLSLEIKVEGNNLRIIGRNWFEEKPFLNILYPRPETDPNDPQSLIDQNDWIRLSNQIRHAVKQEYRSYDFKNAVKNLPDAGTATMTTRQEQLVYKRPDPAHWAADESEAAQTSWDKLTRTFNVTISAVSTDTNVDTMVSHVPLQITARDVRQNGFSGAEIDGRPEAILLKPKDIFKFMALAGNPYLLSFANPRDQQNPITDKYGNLILPLFAVMGSNQAPIFIGFQIQPSHQLAHAQPDTNGFATTGIDLSAFNLGDYPSLLKVKVQNGAEYLTAKDVPYAAYDDVADKSVEDRQKAFKTAAEKIAEAESFFGVTAGSTVKAIYLTPSQYENAHVMPNMPDTVYIWDEIFEQLVTDSGSFVAAHEAFHSLDMRFGLSDHKTVQDLHLNLVHSFDSPIFALINESSYLGLGGHSEENPDEFVASLINTLFIPEFVPHFKMFSATEKGLYAHALSALKTAIENSSESKILLTSPLYARLNAFLGVIQNEIAIPPLTDLLIPTMEQALLNTDSALPVVPVLDAKTFRKALNKNLSFTLFVYNPDDQHLAESVRYLAQIQPEVPLAAIPLSEAIAFLPEFNNQLSSGTLSVFAKGEYAGSFKVPEALALEPVPSE